MTNDELIAQLDPSIRDKAQCFLTRTAAAGFDLRITSGYRSFAEQDALYAQGRTTPGKIVTNAKGGESFHNFGLAFDVVDQVKGYNVDWGRLEAIGSLCNLEHGDRGFIDLPHFQFRGGLTLAQVQAGQRPAVDHTSTMYKEFATDRDYFNDKYTDIVFTFKSAAPSPADLDFAYNEWKSTGEQMYTVAQKQYANELSCVFNGCPAVPDQTEMMNHLALAEKQVKDLTVLNTQLEQSVETMSQKVDQDEQKISKLNEDNTGLETRIKTLETQGLAGYTGLQLVGLGIKKLFS